MRARFPTMAGVDAMQLEALLRRSTFSREDRQIAISLLQWTRIARHTAKAR